MWRFRDCHKAKTKKKKHNEKRNRVVFKTSLYGGVFVYFARLEYYVLPRIHFHPFPCLPSRRPDPVVSNHSHFVRRQIITENKLHSDPARAPRPFFFF